ncbi:hypothetical protein VNO77_26802 [Canavalia gladiata]|uniref:Uncharacterized protein n=1 Tax=Canavalia gladiata TaxID=3824 RepID=A0AAN9KVR6_CANGL
MEYGNSLSDRNFDETEGKRAISCMLKASSDVTYANEGIEFNPRAMNCQASHVTSIEATVSRPTVDRIGPQGSAIQAIPCRSDWPVTLHLGLAGIQPMGHVKDQLELEFSFLSLSLSGLFLLEVLWLRKIKKKNLSLLLEVGDKGPPLDSFLLPKASGDSFIKLILTLIDGSSAFLKLHITQEVKLVNGSSGANPRLSNHEELARTSPGIHTDL